MFQSLGNLFANSVWEELLHSTSSTSQTDDTPDGSSKANKSKLFHARKPERDDPISLKERFIHAKYSEKVFVRRMTKNHRLLSVAQQVWESICANDKKAVYQHIVKSDVDVNAINGQALHGDSFNMPSSSNSSMSSQSKSQLMEDIQDGSSVLHLACLTCDAGMVEPLLQYGADMNALDSRGQTPLHYCIMRGKIAANAGKKPVVDNNNYGKGGLFVKINMDGVPIGRKVDLNAYDTYENLSNVVDHLFRGLLAGDMQWNVDEKGVLRIRYCVEGACWPWLDRE